MSAENDGNESETTEEEYETNEEEEEAETNEEEFNIKDEKTNSSTSSYIQTDYSTPCCVTSSLLTTYPPRSVSTKDFVDSTASSSAKLSDDYQKKSIVREFSREFEKTGLEGVSVKASSKLLFQKIACSHCTSESLPSWSIRKKSNQKTEKPKTDGLLENTLILSKFNDIFSLPVHERNAKRIAFKEKLIISYNPGCETKINFGKSDLELNPRDKHLISDFSERVGEFSLNIEEDDSQFVTYCKSQLSINDSIGGTKIISMISDDFCHIEEKRTEWYFENENKIEKNIHVVMENDNYVAFLDHSDSCKVTSRRGELNLKASGDFLQDGGVYVLMRYLIIRDYIGSVQFWTLDVNGKIGLCKMDFGVRRNIIINGINYNTIRVKRELFRANCKKEISKTYFLSSGHIVLHQWKGCSYCLHLDNTLRIPAKLEWNLEHDWMHDIILSSQFRDEQNRTSRDINRYFDEHPQIKNLLHDYLLFLLQLKPENVLEYTINYFLNMFRDYN